MDQATPNRQSSSRSSDCEIIYDTDEFNLYRIFKKYEQLEQQVEERLAKIKQKKNK